MHNEISLGKGRLRDSRRASVGKIWKEEAGMGSQTAVLLAISLSLKDQFYNECIFLVPVKLTPPS